MTTQKDINKMLKKSDVKSINYHAPSNRYYVNFKSADVSFKGDKFTKIWFDDNGITIERSRGTMTNALNTAIDDFVTTYDNGDFDIDTIDVVSVANDTPHSSYDDFIGTDKQKSFAFDIYTKLKSDADALIVKAQSKKLPDDLKQKFILIIDEVNIFFENRDSKFWINNKSKTANSIICDIQQKFF